MSCLQVFPNWTESSLWHSLCFWKVWGPSTLSLSLCTCQWVPESGWLLGWYTQRTKTPESRIHRSLNGFPTIQKLEWTPKKHHHDVFARLKSLQVNFHSILNQLKPVDPWKVRKTLKLNQKTFAQMWDICSLECVDDFFFFFFFFSVTAPTALLNLKLGEQCYFFSRKESLSKITAPLA